MDSKLRTFVFGFLATAMSAVAYFYGTGLHPRWYLTWIATLPVLMFALRSSRRWAAAAAFLAYSLGGLNMLHYFRQVTPLPVTLLILLAPSAFLAGIVVVFSTFARRGQLVRATFAVPVLWVAMEFLSAIDFAAQHFWKSRVHADGFSRDTSNRIHHWNLEHLVFAVPCASKHRDDHGTGCES